MSKIDTQRRVGLRDAMGTILAGTQEFWIGPWLGLASEPAGNRHTRSWPVRGKHGHDAECPRLVPNGPTPAMTVRVLVVDDEPDVEALFRQQFRRKIRKAPRLHRRSGDPHLAN